MKPRPAFCRWMVVTAFALTCMFIFGDRAEAQSCTINSIVAGSYGTISNLLTGTNVDSTSTFRVTCTGTNGRDVRLCLELARGSTPSGGAGERALLSGSNFLDHEFYSDAARTSIWGSWGSVVTPAYSTGGVQSDLSIVTGGTASVTFTVYGRIALAGQRTKVPATYTWTGSPQIGLRYRYNNGNACPGGNNTRTATGFNWTATVAAQCVVSAQAIPFPSSGLLTANKDATGTVTPTCTSTTPYTIALDGGTTGATNPTQRKMSKGTERVTYGIYRNSARTQPWGSTQGTNTASGTGTGSSQNFTAYGRVPAQTTPSPGNYADTVVTTITY
jgi:spore coat protein U-like protein